MGCIKFNINTKNLIYPFIFPLFYQFRFYFTSKLDFDIKKDTLFLTLMLFTGHLLCGIILIIQKKLIQRNLETSVNKKKSYNYTKQLELSRFKKFKITDLLFIFLIAVIEFTVFNYINLENNSTEIDAKQLGSVIRTSQIIVLSLLCYKILNYPIHRHQQYCLLIFIICDIILLTLNIIQIAKTDNLNSNLLIRVIIGYAISYFLYSIRRILEKYLIERRFYFPTAILFYEGIFGILFCFLTTIITSNIKCKNKFFFGCTEGEKVENLFDTIKLFNRSGWYIILTIFLCFSVNICSAMTVAYFSPCYLSISDIMSSVLLFFSNIRHNFKTRYFFFLELVSYFFMLCSCFIYTEIMILKIKGFSTDVKTEIVKRMDIDNAIGINDIQMCEFDNKTSEEIIDEIY